MRNLIFSAVSFLMFLSGYSQIKEPTQTEALLNIKVTNYDEIPRNDEEVILVAKKTAKKYIGITDENGKCLVLLPKGDTYTIQYKKFTESVDYSEVEVPNQEGLITFDLSIMYEPSKTYTLENVLFETGKATLKPSSYPSLDNLAELLQRKESMVIEIAGHTDDVGTSGANMELSQQRANSVRNYLIKKGVSSQRIIAKGYGDTRPVATNLSVEGRQQNRRTEVVILKE